MKEYIITIISVAFLMLSPLLLKAQQEPYNTMFAFNKLPVNSGYTGGKDELSIRAVYRHQWVGLPGNPKTLNFNIHSPLKYDRLALGFSLMNDQLGATNDACECNVCL